MSDEIVFYIVAWGILIAFLVIRHYRKKDYSDASHQERVINCRSNDNFQHFYSQLQRRTGVKKSFHTTRHTFASRCAMNGWSIAEISAQGGWKNLSILKRYTHIKASYLSKKLGNC